MLATFDEERHLLADTSMRSFAMFAFDNSHKERHHVSARAHTALGLQNKVGLPLQILVCIHSWQVLVKPIEYSESCQTQFLEGHLHG